MTTRRDFVWALGACAVLAPVLRRTGGGPAVRSAPGVGMQLYMARAIMRTDPERTIAKIADLGFSEVEWWGNWDRTPEVLRASLDANKLTSPSWHVGTGTLQPEALARALDVANTMGHRTIIIASLGGGDKADVDTWKRVGELMSRAGEKAKPRGIRIGYHNHGGEGRRFDGRLAYDVLVESSDPATVDFQLDAFWALNDGLQPTPLLRRHAARITSVHLKDAADGTPLRQVDLGKGIIDWRTFLTTAIGGRVSSIFLDIDDPADLWETCRAAREYLRALGY